MKKTILCVGMLLGMLGLTSSVGAEPLHGQKKKPPVCECNTSSIDTRVQELENELADYKMFAEWKFVPYNTPSKDVYLADKNLHLGYGRLNLGDLMFYWGNEGTPNMNVVRSNYSGSMFIEPRGYTLYLNKGEGNNTIIRGTTFLGDESKARVDNSGEAMFNQLQLEGLSGNGKAYLCVDEQGYVYRSEEACK
jgi:hypothetical protein